MYNYNNNIYILLYVCMCMYVCVYDLFSICKNMLNFLFLLLMHTRGRSCVQKVCTILL